MLGGCYLVHVVYVGSLCLVSQNLVKGAAELSPCGHITPFVRIRPSNSLSRRSLQNAIVLDYTSKQFGCDSRCTCFEGRQTVQSLYSRRLEIIQLIGRPNAPTNYTETGRSTDALNCEVSICVAQP